MRAAIISEGRVHAQHGLSEGEKGRAGIGVKLRLQVEGELPLLGERRAAHFHRQAAVPRAPAVQAQIAAHMPQFGVVVDLLPFLQQKHNDDDVENLLQPPALSTACSPVCCRSPCSPAV